VIESKVNRQYSNAVSISVDELKWLSSRVAELCPFKSFNARYQSGLQHTYDSLTDLESLDNSAEDPILEIELQFGSDGSDHGYTYVSIAFNKEYDWVAVRGQGAPPAIELFARQAKSLVEKTETWYSPAARFFGGRYLWIMPSSFIGFILLWVFSGGLYEYFVSGSPLASWLRLCGVTSFFLLSASAASGFLKELFPRIELRVGENLSAARNRETIRTVVVVAFAVSLAAGIVLSWI